MDLSFLKNPIILAIIAGALSYLYLYMENKRKQDENPKAKIEPINYTIPGIIALGTLFLAYSYFGFNNGVSTVDNAQVAGVIEQLPKLNQGFTEGNNHTDSFGSNTFHLVGKNSIKLPQTDVFIDLAHF